MEPIIYKQVEKPKKVEESGTLKKEVCTKEGCTEVEHEHEKKGFGQQIKEVLQDIKETFTGEDKPWK